jgi:hypothetical protein
LLVQYNKETGKNEFPIGSALLNTLSPTRRKANYENMKSDQSRLQDFFSNSMVPEIFGGKTTKEKEDMFKRLQEDMKTEKGRDTASTLYGQAKQNNYDLSDKKNTYGKGLEKFNEAVEKSGSIAQSAAGGVSAAFEKIKASGIAAKAGAFAANVGIGLAASALMQLGAMALSWVGTKIQKAATYDKDKIEAADKTRTNYQDKLSDTKTNISTLKGNKTEFESLSKGVDEYGNNISLDTSSYERFLNIRKEILDTTPSLISGYDAEGNAIAKTSGLIDKAIESQEKKLKSTQKDYSSDATWDKLNKGNQESLKKAAGGLLDKSLSKDIESTRKNISDEIYKRTSSSGDSFGKAFGDATKKVIGGKKALDLTKDADISKFANNYSKIFDQMKEDNPSISTEAIEANVSKYVARYNKMMKEIKSLAKQYKEDFQNTVSASDGYDKLSSKGQSFLSGIAGNIIDFDNANEKDLTDDNISKKRKDLQKITKEFTKNKKAQEDLDELVKTTNKTGGKSAKKWSEDVQDAYNDLTKTLGKKVDGKTLSAALEDAFDFKFSKDGDILHDGKNVEDMISSIQDKLGKSKDTTKFLDGLDFTEMSQAFDILNSKTQVWTGSLDQLKERLKLINQTKSQSTWSDYLQAKETANSGDTYLAMREAFNAQKKERDKGLIGTDDFKTLTSVMSSSGKTDAATFDKTWAKTTKYFTSDNSGLVKFLDDLSAKSQKANTDFGTLKKTAEGTYSGKITNTATAAKAMGMGIEPFEAVLNRLKDYGGKIDFKSVTEQYGKAESTVNELAGKWKDMKDGAGKTALGEQIEDYRQQILKLKNAGKDIPDEMIKKLKFEIEIAEDKTDYDTAYSKLQGATKVGDKKLTKKYQKQVNQESFEYGSSLIDNVRPTAKKNGYYLKDEGKLKEWETAQYTKLGKLRKNAIEDPSQANYKTLNDFLSKLSETATTITSGKSSLGAYEKAITSKKALNERLNEIAPGTKVNKKNQIQLTGNKEKDSQINSAYKNYNDSAPKGSKKVTTIEVKADTKKAKSDIKETTKPQDKKVTVKTDTKNAKKENKKVTKSENKKITYKADTKDTDKADKKQGKTVSKKIKVRSDYSDAEKKILAWAGVPVDKKGRLIGDISDANQKVLNWIGIKVSKTGKLKGNISDATKKTNQWKNQKVSKTGKLKADTSSADRTVSAWASNPITRIVNFITGKTPSTGGNQAHGTANAHGSFIPKSNAYVQGTVDDLTDWYDDELDDIEEFGAFAHGTIKKLGSRALAMGTTKISDLSEINPVVQAEKNKYLQEKTDKLKSSVGNAHANGGDWGLKQDERALTGELGDELVV